MDVKNNNMHQVSVSTSLWHKLPTSGKNIVNNFLKNFFCKEFIALLRYEFDMVVLSAKNFISISYSTRIKSINKLQTLKLHLGCGNNFIEDWINIDSYPILSKKNKIVRFDMRKKFPFHSNTVDAIYSEHLLEHIPFNLVNENFLPECLRVLKSGGRIRMGVPDGEWLLEKYIDAKNGILDSNFINELPDGTPMMKVNFVARGTMHFYLYDYELLENIFSKCGFLNCKKSRANESEFDVFDLIDNTNELRVQTTLYIEAVKK